MKILITGGAGFVGSSLAFLFRESDPLGAVHVVDNLRRRGAELNLPKFKQRGIDFTHGDVRIANDLEAVSGNWDVVVDASAEPSVLAGIDGSPQYVLQTNIDGTIHCLEFARQRAGALIFLSTSRVYSIKALQEIALREEASRFEIDETQPQPGVSVCGIAEGFATDSARSFYGTSKFVSELLIQEYVDSYGLRAIVNRCGVIAGPGQFGRTDQGVFTLWVAHHHFGLPLRYTGFGGSGKQVRDLMHPADLFRLIQRQLDLIEKCTGEVFNVGGGRENSISLLELTSLCRQVTGHEVQPGRQIESNRFDVPLFICDTNKVRSASAWKPEVSVQTIVQETAQWLAADEAQLRPLFA